MTAVGAHTLCQHTYRCCWQTCPALPHQAPAAAAPGAMSCIRVRRQGCMARQQHCAPHPPTITACCHPPNAQSVHCFVVQAGHWGPAPYASVPLPPVLASLCAAPTHPQMQLHPPVARRKVWVCRLSPCTPGLLCMRPTSASNVAASKGLGCTLTMLVVRSSTVVEGAGAGSSGASTSMAGPRVGSARRCLQKMHQLAQRVSACCIYASWLPLPCAIIWIFAALPVILFPLGSCCLLLV